MSLEYTEKQESKIKEYCERNSIKESDLKEQIEAKYEELEKNGELIVEDDPEKTHERRMARSIRAGQGYFRRFIKNLRDAKPGMLICRHRDIGFDQFQINIALKYRDENGIAQAIEQGYMNDKEQCLYTSGVNVGKVIPKPKSYTRITGYITTTDKKGNKFHDIRCFSVNEDAIHKRIPMCEHVRVSYGEGTKELKGYPYTKEPLLFYRDSGVIADQSGPYDENELAEILEAWNELIDDLHFCPTFKDLVEFQGSFFQNLRDKENKNAFTFCTVPAMCAEIYVDPEDEDKTYIDRMVTITMLETNGDMHDLTCFVPLETLQGLNIEEGMQGLAVLQAYKTKEEDTFTKWHLGGFLPISDDIVIEEYFGAEGDEE